MKKIFKHGVLLLFLVALAKNIIFLDSPNQVIFDEVHFGKFVTAYCCTGERFFDIHPPHSKLLIAGTAYLLGYRGGFDFKNIGEEYVNASAFALRFLPAIAGALLPIIMYAILRQLNVSKPFSFLGALVVILDNAITVQSRIIGLDTILLVATFSSLWCFLRWMMTEGRRNPWWIVASGALAGLAVGTKFTGVSAMGLVGVALLANIAKVYWQQDSGWWKGARTYVEAAVIFLAAASVVYLFGWFLHFELLDKPGSGDAWGQRTGNFAHDIVQEHKSMLNANYNLNATHSHGSKWWSWPVMSRPVFYWAGEGNSWIYFQGNPVVWWGSSLLFVAAIASYVFDRHIRQRMPLVVLLPLGFLVSYVPFMRIPRVLFLYHYLTPLLFTILFGIWWLDVQFEKHPRRQKIVQLATIALVIAFLLFTPVTYGFDGWQDSLIWFSSWR